jgi:3-hydroxy-9,10-secoandrosta-1,3,5(10)-triene-9,17-dione monooxygenase reductase component
MTEHARAVLPSGDVTPARFRHAMGQFATGVAVITAHHDGQPYGMTVNSLTSVSLDPPLLLICPQRGSATGTAIQAAGGFAVNILRDGQQDVCLRFVGEGAARFDGLATETGPDGVPLIPDALAHLICRLVAVHPGGDHDILVAEVVDCTAAPGDPLLYHEGRFCRRAA